MISEKNILQTDFEGEKFARIYLGKIISCPEKNFPNDVYSAEKKLTPLYVREKCLAPEVWEKKNLAQTKSPISPPPRPPTAQKSQMGNHIGGGEEAGEFDTFSRRYPSTKWLSRVHHVVVFKTKVFHFKVENTTIKDTSGNRNFK